MTVMPNQHVEARHLAAGHGQHQHAAGREQAREALQRLPVIGQVLDDLGAGDEAKTAEISPIDFVEARLLQVHLQHFEARFAALRLVHRGQ